MASSQLQRPPQTGQYYQMQHDQTHEPQIVIHQQIQQPNPQQPPPQIIHYDYYEAPMTLNAWTQTSSDDFPSIVPSMNSKAESALLAKIQHLERSLRIQSAELDEIKKQNSRSLTPQIVSNSNTTLSSNIKHESTTYRILTQPNESNSETQIEIELSDESIDPIISTPNVYALKDERTPKGVTYTPNDVKSVSKVVKPVAKDVKHISKDVTLSPNYGNCIPTIDSMTTIGPCGTKIPTADFEKIAWTSASITTRKLLTTIFNRETLATHSMTGKASPAFKDLDKPVKGRLDPNVIQDIVHIVSQKCGVSAKEVRSAITTKCADENKMLKLKQLKSSGVDCKRSILKECNKKT